MIRFASEQEIDRSAAEIWAYAADVTQHPRWMGVEDAAIVRGESGEVGMTFRETDRLTSERLQGLLRG